MDIQSRKKSMYSLNKIKVLYFYLEYKKVI